MRRPDLVQFVGLPEDWTAEPTPGARMSDAMRREVVMSAVGPMLDATIRLVTDGALCVRVADSLRIRVDDRALAAAARQHGALPSCGPPREPADSTAESLTITHFIVWSTDQAILVAGRARSFGSGVYTGSEGQLVACGLSRTGAAWRATCSAGSKGRRVL